MKIFSRCFLMIEFPPAKNPIPLYVAGKNSNMDSAMINTGNKEDRKTGAVSGFSAAAERSGKHV
jgi:hypothetical protein